MKLQVAQLISSTEAWSSARGSSDRHAQLLTVGNFKNNLKIEQNFSARYVL